LRTLERFLPYDPTVIPSIRRRLAAAALAAAFLGSAACGFDFGPRAEARDEWSRSYKVSKGATLEIRGTNGKIRVEPSDGDTIEVAATRIVRASTDEAARKELADFKMAETVSPDSVTIDSTGGTQLSFRLSKEVQFRIKAPRGISLVLKETNGEIDTSGITGMLRAETTNGRIRAAGLEDGARVETTNGTVDLDFAKLSDNGVRASTTNGAVVVRVPKDVKARISASVSNGEISTSELDVKTTEQSRHKLEATIGGGGPSIHVETTNGAIQIKGR